eukprot:CFRG8252T1
MARLQRVPLKRTDPLLRLYSSSASADLSSPVIELNGQRFERDSQTNVKQTILDKVGRNLLTQPHHPLKIIKDRINNYFQETSPGTFSLHDNMSPIVTVEQNFNSVLTPPDHVSRSKNDTYYLNQNALLRTHTSAHQADMLRQGHRNFLLAGDVYRRDEIDSSHYPVFHQMEGMRMFGPDEMPGLGNMLENGVETEEKQAEHTLAAAQFAEKDLKRNLEGMTSALFGDVEMRWVSAYFPFTHPSWELEIYFKGDWLEVLGCGITRQQMVYKAGTVDHMGWAFGMGLERLAMVLYDISDIRLFWSDDERFLKQFDETTKGTTQFTPFSKHPPCKKDLAFWLPNTGAHFVDNDFFELVRNAAGDIVENVEMIDEFMHPKTMQHSKCYRITYRSMDRPVSNEEINLIQERVRSTVAEELKVTLR